MKLLPQISFCARFVAIACGCAAVCCVLPARANDGGIGLGGSPGLLIGHPSIVMTSEVIRIRVTDRTLTADCRFVFTNHGPACVARMGFPDEGEGASDPDEENDAEQVMRTPPRTTFTSFRSYVDGNLVPTSLIRANEEGKYWHTKRVSFPAGGIRRIRDVYTQSVGGYLASIGGKPGFMTQIGYILHTGSSWHGRIGRSEVVVTFDCTQMRGAVRPLPLRQAARASNPQQVNESVMTPNTVLWRGPCAPATAGKTLRFVRTNWHPTDRDDLEISYGYQLEAAISTPVIHTAWSADASRMSLPHHRAEGLLYGEPFAAHYVNLVQQMGANGKSDNPDERIYYLILEHEGSPEEGRETLPRAAAAGDKLVLAIHTPPAITPAGQTLLVGPDYNTANADFPKATSPWIEWATFSPDRANRQGNKAATMLLEPGRDFTLRLEFDPPQGDLLRGRLYFCLRQAAQGAIAGHFRVRPIVDTASSRREQEMVQAAERGDVAAFQSLMARGCSVNVLPGRRSPLMAAAEGGHLTAVTFLIAHGADLEATDRPGYRTPLLCARNAACVEALLKAGARADAGDVDGETALFHWAGQPTAEAASVARALIAHGADVNSQGEAGETTLHAAVAGGNRAIVEMLLARGAKTNWKDDAGDTPLMIAQRNGRSDMVALLKRADDAR